MGHRRYSASAAHRWIACTASHAIEATLPNTTSKYAAEGTRAHAFASYLLAGGTLEPGEQIAYEDGGKEIATVVDAETLESIAPYVDFVRGMLANGATDLRVEFSADVVPGDLGGTTDAVFLRKSTLHVCDLKYGKGVIVDPEENAQLMCYALACLPYYPQAKQVCLNIIQPRASHGEIVKQWRCSLDRLQTFGHKVRAAIDAIKAGRGIFVRGEHCQFCKALHGCPSYFDAIEPATKSDGLVTVEQRAYILEHIEDIRRLCNAVEKEAEDRLRNGEEIEGWKLVQKTPRAKWRADAPFALRDLDAMFRRELIGITEARKLLGDQIEAYIVKESSGVVMVRAADKRPEIIAGEMLDEIGEIENA